jgi:hypothetical protein
MLITVEEADLTAISYNVTLVCKGRTLVTALSLSDSSLLDFAALLPLQTRNSNEK